MKNRTRVWSPLYLNAGSLLYKFTDVVTPASKLCRLGRIAISVCFGLLLLSPKEIWRLIRSVGSIQIVDIE